MAIPPSRNAGDSGHVADHNALATELAATEAAVAANTAALAGKLDATTASGTYRARLSEPQTITWNADGTVATVTETDTGAVLAYTYNADGTPATEARTVGGVTTTRTFTYTSGNLTGVA